MSFTESDSGQQQSILQPLPLTMIGFSGPGLQDHQSPEISHIAGRWQRIQKPSAPTSR